jgi:ParB-like chromosome segregation protein Spo0J
MSIQFATDPAPVVDRVEQTPPVGVRWHEYADIFPWIEGPAFEELKADIAKNGVLEPIVFLDGAILDGRNRYMAARALGIEYPRVEYTGGDPLGFVISHNLQRRHLTESQRAMVTAKLAKLPKGRPAENTEISVFKPTQTEAAKMLNVSVDSVQFARKVQEQGTPELARAVEEGKVSVSAAASIVDQPPEVQREVVAQPNVKKAVSELRKSVLEAAKQGAAGGSEQSNKNPHYQAPTKAGEAWTKLYGSCRALAEWASDENMLLALHGKAERTDDQTANVAAIQKAADALTKFLGDINAQ